MVSGLTPALPCPGRALRFAPRQRSSCNSLSLLRRQREARGAGEPVVSERARCKKNAEKGLLSSSLQQLGACARRSLAARRRASRRPGSPLCREPGPVPARALAPGAWQWRGSDGESSAGARRQRSPSLLPFDVAAVFISVRNHRPLSQPRLARSQGAASPGGRPHLAHEWRDGVCEGSAGPWGTWDARGRRPSRPWGAHGQLLATSTAFFFFFFFFSPLSRKGNFESAAPSAGCARSFHCSLHAASPVPQRSPSHASCRGQGRSRRLLPRHPELRVLPAPAPRFAPCPCFGPPGPLGRCGGAGRQPWGLSWAPRCSSPLGASCHPCHELTGLCFGAGGVCWGLGRPGAARAPPSRAGGGAK